MKFSFSGNQDIYLEIAERYKEYIRLGVIRNGEKLPSVRQAAGELSVNPNTIQRSYRSLEAEVWIVTVPGKGCFVCGLRSYSDAEKQELLTAFDKATAALLQHGMTRAELVARLEKEV